MEKKEPLGYRTPSMRIQEEYKALLGQIKQTKANWEQILGTQIKESEGGLAAVERAFKRIKTNPTHGNFMEMEHRMLATGHTLTLAMIARLGTELAESNERFASIESELKSLRRAI